jgi:hypothetical protein
VELETSPAATIQKLAAEVAGDSMSIGQLVRLVDLDRSPPTARRPHRPEHHLGVVAWRQARQTGGALGERPASSKADFTWRWAPAAVLDPM